MWVGGGSQADLQDPPEAVSNTVLYGHVCREGRPVVDVARLPEGTVGPAHVVVVPADDDTPAQLPAGHRLVEPLGQGGPTSHVGVEDPRLGADHHLVFGSLRDPPDVVRVLLLDLPGHARLHDPLQDLPGQPVRRLQVGGKAGGADPPEQSTLTLNVC